MADGTRIEWTEATWNPITGCTVTSPGCTNCYAMKLAGTRLQHHWSRKGLTQDTKAGPVWTGEVRLNEEWLTQPLKWKRPRMIFVCAHGDLFHESVPDAWIDKVFAVMALAPQHTFQVLTKRSARMHSYLGNNFQRTRVQTWSNIIGLQILSKRLSDHDAEEAEEFVQLATSQWPLPNVWLGVSVEDQTRADERIPDLLATPAAVRWLSCEPLLQPVDLTSIKAPRYPEEPEDSLDTDWRFDALTTGDYYWFDCGDGFTDGGDGPYREARIDWVVAGGESGPGARPLHPDWVRALRDQCANAVLHGDDAPVPFFFKQWGEWAPVYDREATDPDWRRCYVIARMYPGGKWLNLAGGCGFHGERLHWVHREGKKRAGRMLDGVEHSAMPAPR